MKKRSKDRSEGSDDLRSEYRFDYAKARPNPYATRLRGRVLAVVLDPEVAAAFPTSDSVNSALRSVMGVVPRRSSGGPLRKRKGRPNKGLKRTSGHSR
jgi:hypothetical protein